MITSETLGGVEVVRLSGRLDSVNAPALEAAILAKVEGGTSRLVLDCADVAYVSSAGLRVFLIVAKKLKAYGGRLALSALRPEVREVFAISGFLQILSDHARLDDAVAFVERDH